MTPGALSTLSPVRYPVAAPPVRLKPASGRIASGATSWAGLTRPATAATPHPSSGPGDRNSQNRTTRDDAAIAREVDDVEETARAASLDSASIEAIARRVAELLEHPFAGRPGMSVLIDAGELARRTGISRAWIYQHAHELGAIRLGHGPKARLRFRIETVEQLLEPATQTSAGSGAHRRRREQSPPSGAEAPLIPIRGVRPALSRLGLLRRRGH
jgi:hypothetical protein